MNLYCLNLGFSGSARGEDAITEYMANLDMSVFVLDYDHNAPTVEHLEATHEKVYKAVRAKHPDMPIVIASSIPVRGWSRDAQIKRREVIYQTYKNAVEAGDKNVYFLNGEEFFSNEVPFDYCTVDGCHPNDVGMLMMAKGFEKVLVKVI
jgi:lysophospholipase L1-like esterase